jgi:tRNA U34 2-thiouridine synthase MnmA/TrmU
MQKKAIALLSGGLDSTLAVKLLIDLGVEVIALNFKSPFCNCTGKNSSCKNEAARVAKEFNIPIRAGFLGEDFLRAVENPVFGYGRNMNPCLDCRILMFKKAKEIMIEEGASFVFTGEVIGQRPMSQRREAMILIEKNSGLEGLILRPLSASYFEPTIPEKEGIVPREKLLSLNGRTRKPQIELAKKMKISDYPCPAGGCLLTETKFSNKVKDLIREKGRLELKDVNMLKLGRHFRLKGGKKVIVGRDEEENNKIQSMAAPEDTLFQVSGYGSAIAWIRGEALKDDIQSIAQIAARYSSAPKEEKIEVAYQQKSGANLFTITTTPMSDGSLDLIRI